MNTNSDTLDQYVTWLRSWGASPATVAARRSVIRRHLSDFPHGATTQDLAAFLALHADQPWTARTYFTTLRSFYGWAADAGIVAEDSTARLKAPRVPQKRPRPLTQDEIARVLDAAEGNVRAYCVLALFNGLRAHEIAKIHGRDVTETELRVRGKGGRDDVIPTSPAVWALAQQYPRDAVWFPGYSTNEHVQASSVTRAMTTLFKRLGIEGSTHRLRHSHASTLLRNGVNLRVIQTLMRHSSLDVTSGYLAVAEDEQRAALATMLTA